jgi:serine/threonine protein kinase
VPTVIPHGVQVTIDDPDAALPQDTSWPDVSILDSGRPSTQLLPSDPPAAIVAAAAAPTLLNADLPDEIAPGMRFADYEILAELGRGGMGVVYQARQISLKRPVALKMILGGSFAAPAQRARFRREAESVAHLDHPNIVQVYEIGEHGGQPYFSMEYVDGVGLDSRIAGKPQPPRAAAALVETLARAMHHAHERGIVHRDLKPSNVLLAFSREPRASAASVGVRSGNRGASGASSRLNEGVAKITDFGLAKQLTEGGGQTQSGAILGSPSYMAPEQADGRTKHVTPAADTYALGAILYETLTGLPPFLGETAAAIVMDVVSKDPVPPRQLQPKVPRDLETICLKCLQKDPMRRYASAGALADDLHRFLAGEPIHGRPMALPERALKWARRRPAVAALLGSGVLAAAVVLAVSLAFNFRLRAEARRSEANFRLALKAVDEMLTEVGDEQLVFEPRMEEKRRRLLEKALDFYRQFLDDKTDDAELRSKTSLAYKRKADILRLLNEKEKSRTAYDQAIGMLSQLTAAFPDDLDYREALADSYNWRGELLRLTGNRDEARASYEQALKVAEELADAFPDVPLYRSRVARCHDNLGILLKESSRFDEAQAAFEHAISIGRELVDNHPTNLPLQQELARAYLNLGPVLRRKGQLQEAETAYNRAIWFLQNLVNASRDNPEYRRELAVGYTLLGTLLGKLPTPRWPQAKQAHRQAIALLEKLTRDFPSIPLYKQELANTYNSLARKLTAPEEAAEKEKAYRDAQLLLEELVAESPGTPEYHGDLGLVLENIGRWRLNQGNRQAARQILMKAVEQLEAALQGNPHHPDYEPALRDSQKMLADLKAQPGGGS